jgi:hypothetical protein
MSEASYNKDRIETVIFTPTTSYYCEKPDCVQERVVSYENMDELKAKLYNLYSSNNETISTTRRMDEIPHQRERNSHHHRLNSSNLEEEEYEDDDDLLVPLDTELPYQLYPSSRRRRVIEPIPIPPPTSSPTNRTKAPKEKNRLRRFYSKGWGRLRIC